MQLVYGADAIVAAWVAARMPNFDDDDSFGVCTGIGVVEGDKLIAGAVFHDYRGHNIEISFAADDARWATRKHIRAIFAYPFNQLGCVRLTTITSKKNARARKLDEGLGFRIEGVIRKGYDGKQDAIIYGMLKHECKWIRK